MPSSILPHILAALLGYIFGSVSIAVLITRAHYGGDVRAHGSGNAGATNVARVFGMQAGVITLLGDMAKTAVSALFGWLLAGADGLALACTACIVGHCFPVFFGFRGGKGVSVGACIALIFDVRMLLVLLVLFVILFLLFRRVSVCSMAAALSYPGLYYLFNPSPDLRFWLCCFIGLLVFFLHRGNLMRLLRGQEPKFRPGSKP